MSNIVIKLQNAVEYCGGRGVDQKQIAAAEKKLGISFSKEYKEYLENIGLCMVNGHELTGISDESRTNVVDVTEYHRSISSEMPKDMYVVEETSIDGIIVLQDKKGSIYSFSNGNIVKVSNSILEYLSL